MTGPSAEPSRRARAREALLRRLPAGSKGAEIGVWKGDFSALILDTVRPARLYLVDPWTFRPDRWMPTFGTGLLVNSRAEVLAAGGPQAHLDALHVSVVERFHARPEVSVIRAASHDFLVACAAHGLALDWVYIDGDHSFAGALSDLQGAWSAVRPGGLITGDDFGFTDHGDGGRKAVREALASFLATHPGARATFFREGGQWGFTRTTDASPI